MKPAGPAAKLTSGARRTLYGASYGGVGWACRPEPSAEAVTTPRRDQQARCINGAAEVWLQAPGPKSSTGLAPGVENKAANPLIGISPFF